MSNAPSPIPIISNHVLQMPQSNSRSRPMNPSQPFTNRNLNPPQWASRRNPHAYHARPITVTNGAEWGPIGTDFPTVDTTWCISRANRPHVRRVSAAGGTHLTTGSGAMQVIQTEGVLRVTFYVRIGRQVAFYVRRMRVFSPLLTSYRPSRFFLVSLQPLLLFLSLSLLLSLYLFCSLYLSLSLPLSFLFCLYISLSLF